MAYENWLTGERANKQRRYIQILDFIANTPNCTRKSILWHLFEKCRPDDYEQMYVWTNRKHNASKKTYAYRWRGHHSNTFANLITYGAIKYNSKYEYTITPIGEKLLERAKNAK